MKNSISERISRLQKVLNVIENFEPVPTLLETLTWPPIYSTIDLQMLNPRPLPVGLTF